MKIYPYLAIFPLLFITQTSSAQMKSLQGPFGGWSYTLQNNADYFFAGTGNGIYRSADGSAWKLVGNSPNDYFQWHLLDVSDQAVLALSYIPGEQKKYLHISEDAGASWVKRPLPDSIALKFTMGAIAGQRILLAHRNGQLWESTNLGQSWAASAQYGKLLNIDDLEGAGERLYITAQNRLLISEKTSFNYTQLVLPTGVSGKNISVLDSLVFIYDTGKQRFYRFKFGSGWQPSDLTGFGNSDHFVAAHKGVLYTLHKGQLAESSNLGVNWTVSPTLGNETPDFIGATEQALVALDAAIGAFRADKPTGPWLLANRGMANGRVSRLAAQNSHLFAGADYTGLFRYEHSSGQWNDESLFPIRNTFGDLYGGAPNRLFAVQNTPWTDTLAVGLSNDAGASWQNITPPFSLPEFNRIAAQGQYVYGWTDKDDFTVNNLLQSADLGLSWSDLNANIFQQTGVYSSSFCLADSLLLAGSTKGVLRSQDAGANWTLHTTGLPVNDPYFRIPQLLRVDSLLFAIIHSEHHNNQFYRSADLGLSWAPVTAGPTIAISPTNTVTRMQGLVRFDGRLLMAYYTGLYISTDEGLTWAPYPGLLPNLTALLATDTLLYLGTGSRGVWTATAADFVYEQLSGRVFWDDNGNGIQDGQEKGAKDIRLYLEKYKRYAWTDAAGDYQLEVHFGAGASALYPLIQNSSHTSLVPTNRLVSGSDAGLDFALQRSPGLRDLAVWVTAEQGATPGQALDFTATVRNLGTSAETAGLYFELSDYLDVVSAQPMPQVIGNTLYWSSINLESGDQQEFKIRTNVRIDAPVNLQLQSAASVDPINNDVQPNNNLAYSVLNVSGFTNPNLKIEAHGGTIESHLANAGEALVYTVDFQNTGSVPVERVTIIDPISSGFLDLDKLRVIASSHAYRWNIRPDNALEFVFDGINLPPSTSDPDASRGFITFSLPLRPGAQGIILNRAYVYLDYYGPLSTSVSTEIIYTVSTKQAGAAVEKRLRLFPNPTSGQFNVDLSHLAPEPGLLILADIFGRTLFRRSVQSGNLVVFDDSDLPPGQYAVYGHSLAGATWGTAVLVVQKG